MKKGSPSVLQDRLSDYTLEQSLSLFHWAHQERCLRQQYQISKHAAGAMLGQAVMIGGLTITGVAPFWLGAVSLAAAWWLGRPLLDTAMNIQAIQEKLISRVRERLEKLNLTYALPEKEWDPEDRKKAVTLIYQHAPEEIQGLMRQWGRDVEQQEELKIIWGIMSEEVKIRVEESKEVVISAWKRDLNRKEKRLPPEPNTEFKRKLRP